MKRIVLAFVLFFPALWVCAQGADFRKCEKFSEENLRKYCPALGVYPTWLPDGRRFWYSYMTEEGLRYYIVDAAKRTKEELFEPGVLAGQLAERLGVAFDEKDFRLGNLTFDEGEGDSFTFMKEGELFRYYWKSGRLESCVEPDEEGDGGVRRPMWQSWSADGIYKVYAWKHNLYLLRGEDTTAVQLTTDGERSWSYSVLRDKDSERQAAPAIEWIGDRNVFYCLRQDRRQVEECWVIDHLAEPRPRLRTYKFPMPGEEAVFTYDLHLFYPETGKHVVVDIDKYPDQEVKMVASDLERYPDDLYFVRKSRTCDEMDLCRVDTRTGEVYEVISEVSKPYFTEQLFDCRILNGGEDILWWSERTGWGHYYLYDREGRLKGAVTSGDFVACRMSRVDAEERCFVFEGYGREKGVNPNYRFYYRVNFDGSGLRLLTPGNGYHTAEFSRGGDYLIDTYSRVDCAPVSVLRDLKGKELLVLERTDVSRLEAIGWHAPQRVVVKAADGVTDLYGVMYTPFGMDSTQRYPVIAYVYPGPQEDQVPQAFALDDNCNQSLAQLGFVVVHVGFRGGCMFRGRHFYNFGYGNLRDYPLADCKAMIEQLADRYGFIDLDRVGIYGHSGGGFMAATSLLTYPEFYKVAVAASGNYDNNIYTKWWGEMYHGVKMKGGGDEEGYVFESDIPTTMELAARLRGKLLLITGDVDINVHPANTFRLAHALIEAGKRFDMLVIPGADHGIESPYYYQVVRSYFVEHLLGERLEGADFCGIVDSCLK